MVGETISHYRIVSQLGAGGMGVLYRAEDLRLGRSVALKFVSAELGHDSRAVQRLRAEARAASALNHANICTIYDIDEHNGHPFIVMELMKGRSLRDCLASGPLKIHQVLDVGIESADALHAAHTEGIIHRDIKPGNIFVTERGHVKILDFGLAKLTSLFESSRTTHEVAERTTEGVTLGTVAYMSPEQATGEELDGRTDLFSLGVVLYECATARQPFSGKTSAAVLSAILNRAPVAPVVLNPELPIRLQDVINNCLEKDRELRYQSAADLRADLKRVRRDIESGRSEAVPAVRRGSGPTQELGSGSRRESPPQRGRRDLRTWGAAAAILVTLAAASTYVLLYREPPPVLESRPIATAPDPAIASRLALASASLDARNYRAAVAYAEQVLTLDSGNSDARKIREAAKEAIARFDGALSDARRRIAAGDLRGAERALDVARGIDASGPGLTDVALRIADQSRRRVQDADVPRRDRPSPDPPRSARVPAPASPQNQPHAEPPASSVARPTGGSVEPSPTALPSSVGAAPAIPVAPPPAAVARPNTPAPANGDTRNVPDVAQAGPSAEQDEAAIRRAITTYARAIENKDVRLFRSIKPNLSREEERRLEEGFRAVTSQRVAVTVLSIERTNDEATVVLRRRDIIQAGGRQQTSEVQQAMALARRGGDWIIVEIR